MEQNATFIVDNDVYEKFKIALNLNSDTENIAIENFMRTYISQTFGKVSQVYNTKVPDDTRDFYGKAIQKIPLWAVRPTQCNHKIIRAYFKASELTDEVTIETMELICSDTSRQDLYVPTFKSNYAQMKLDGPKTHGKVFEDNGYAVTIWDEVKDVLMKYKSHFCD